LKIEKPFINHFINYVLAGGFERAKILKYGNLNSLIVHSKSTFAGGVYRDKISFSVHGQLGGYQNSIKFSRDFKNGVVLLSNYVPKGITPTQTSSIIYNAVFN